MAVILRKGKEDIKRLIVGGFKSINQEQSMEIKPLTILAGANSSGKSSMMQALLLLKQTLEATYDPGALLLNGPNVKFTSAEQLLSRNGNGKSVNTFHVGIKITVGSTEITHFKLNTSKRLDVEATTYDTGNRELRLYKGMPRDEIQSVYDRAYRKVLPDGVTTVTPTLIQDRCFLKLNAKVKGEDVLEPVRIMRYETLLEDAIHRIIHLPGLRGNPERDYPVTAVGPAFPGTFEYYVASVIEQWQVDDDKQRLERLYHDLAQLGLTRNVVARRKNDTQVELLVNRFLHGEREDMVSIADVGLGVSQALPVVVALHAAKPGQLVYIEQPEIHLHPRAQHTMAEVLANAAIGGKQLVIETHSSLLLRGIQTLVAEGKLPGRLVKLHWFKRLEDGSTQITSADLDETGAFDDWPEDFDDVELYSEKRYLDAAQARLRGK